MVESIALVPAYNEEKNIKEVITTLKKIGLKSLVVDDGSSDRTYEIANSLGSETLKHKKNKGKGEALKTGLSYILKKFPETKYIIFIDADLQYDPEESLKLLNCIKKTGSDIVIGYRDWRKVPIRHRIGNFLWRSFFNILFGTKLKDTNCGFIIIRTNVARKISISGGYTIENSILAQATKMRFKIEQKKVTINYKIKSNTKRGIEIVLEVLFYIIKEGLKYRMGY